MRKFLVIDDEPGRKDLYSRIFNFLELDFAFTSQEFLTKIVKKYDGYFVDVIYLDDSFKEFSFQEILEKIPEKKPLFVISSKWDEAVDDNKMKYLRTSGKYNDVLGYISWKSIEEANKAELARDFIREQINHYYKYAYNVLDENQCITILQISDVEFGNPEQEKNIDTKGRMIISGVRKILRKLDVDQNTVDFICVCGDIAYLGEKEEYGRAKRWLKNLGEQLLLNANFDNMLIVPGNHDFNFNSVAGSFYTSYGYEEGDKKRIGFKERECERLEYNEQAMYNFAKFVYELTGDTSYLIAPYNPIVKRTYENYGLNFVLLNPVRINKDKSFNYGMTDENMEKLLENFSDAEQHDMCNIVLSHLAPNMYNQIDSSSDSLHKDIENISNELSVKGWLYGHSHSKRYVTDMILGNHKVFMSRTSSLMLNNTQRCEDAQNGFTVIKLYRKNGKVTKFSYFDDEKEKSYTSPFEEE